MTARGLLDADMQTLGGWIADGARWWVEELRAMVPPALRTWLSPRLRQIDYDPATATFAAETGRSWAVALPADLALVRQIPHPPVRGKALQTLIALDADRLMPFGGDGMIVAAQDRIDAPATKLAIAGLPRATAERLAAAIAAQPVQPARVLVATDAGDPVDLLPAMRRADLLPDPRGGALRWWLAVAFLFVLNFALLVWRDVAARDAMADAVAAQQPGMTAVRAITGRMRRADALAGAALADRARVEPLALMARLRSALPPGVWLQRLAWADGALRLTGFRPAGADVSGALRKAGFVTVRYGDGTAPADAAADTSSATPLGQPFEIIVRTGPQLPSAPVKVG